MIEFVGVVPFLRRITLQVAMETMHFEPSPNRFILVQLYLAFMVSLKTIWHPLEIVLGAMSPNLDSGVQGIYHFLICALN